MSRATTQSQVEPRVEDADDPSDPFYYGFRHAYETARDGSEKLVQVPLTFLILDVFARQKHTGNQLAVCFDAGELSTQGMQTIAREFNFPETTFILGDQERDGAWDVIPVARGELI